MEILAPATWMYSWGAGGGVLGFRVSGGVGGQRVWGLEFGGEAIA